MRSAPPRLQLMLLIGLLSSCSIGAFSQSVPAGSNTGRDWPDARPRGSSKDPAALNELKMHRSTSGAGPLRDMEASGTMTFARESNTVEHRISLKTLGDNYYRLDVEGAPYASIRVSPTGANIQNPGKSPEAFHPENILGGYLSLARMRDDLSSRTDISMTQLGASTVDSVPTHEVLIYTALHRGMPLNSGREGEPPTPMVATNLYLSESSHLLIKASTIATAAGSSRSTLLVEDRFDDYRQVDGVLVPFKMTESVGGVAVFTMQLSDVKINQGISDDAFHF